MHFDQASASAPAASEARAMGGTLSRSPVPCDGSPAMGRCESFLMTGMAEISMRVARIGFESADAALAKNHIVIPARHDVLGGKQ